MGRSIDKLWYYQIWCGLWQLDIDNIIIRGYDLCNIMYILCIGRYLRVTKLQYTCIMSHGMYIYILGIRIKTP